MHGSPVTVSLSDAAALENSALKVPDAICAANAAPWRACCGLRFEFTRPVGACVVPIERMQWHASKTSVAAFEARSALKCNYLNS